MILVVTASKVSATSGTLWPAESVASFRKTGVEAPLRSRLGVPALGVRKAGVWTDEDTATDLVSVWSSSSSTVLSLGVATGSFFGALKAKSRAKMARTILERMRVQKARMRSTK